MISFPLRVYQGFHALVVGAFRLNQVNDVELVANVSPSVAHFKEEPLRVVVRPIVVLEYQVIFELTYLNSSSQVARFEPALKDESSVCWVLFYVIRFQFLVESVDS